MSLSFTANDILLGVGKAKQAEWNKPGVKEYPRASGLAGCARSSAYYMAGFAGDKDWDRPDMAFTQEQGRLAEQLTCGGIFEGSGRTVRVQFSNDELEVTGDSTSYTGHPDGELLFLGARADAPTNALQTEWQDVDGEGLKWGFEHKHYGSYGYQKILKGGIFTGGEDVIHQSLLYGAAFGWDMVLICITSQDASVQRRDMSRARKYKDESKRWPLALKKGMDSPKLLKFEVDLRPLYKTLLPLLTNRAKALTEAMKTRDPGDIEREHEPEAMAFPCSYCDYFDDCVADGPSVGGVRVPPLRDE